MSKKKVRTTNGVKLTVDKGISAKDTANQLAQIAETAEDKNVRKQALQALYLLKQAGVVPDVRPIMPVPGNRETIERNRAFASAFDGAGNRLLLFAIAEPDGGSPTLMEVLINDEEGIRDFDALRMPKKDLDTRLDLITDQMDQGLAVAEIPMEYGRWLITQARAVNHRLSRTTPMGFIDWVERIGEPRVTFASSPIFDRIAKDQLHEEETANFEPKALFELSWFGPWFFAAEDIKPWLDRLEAEGGDTTGLQDNDENLWIRQHLEEILEELMPESLRRNYIHRLEESADILERRGEYRAACHALAMATELSDAPTLHESAFARELVHRSFAATAAMAMSNRS